MPMIEQADKVMHEKRVRSNLVRVIVIGHWALGIGHWALGIGKVSYKGTVFMY
jgi:hypothetical protein